MESGTLTQWCFFLADGWRNYVNAPVEDVAAFQYTAINQAILDAKAAVPAGQWVEVVYEDFLRDPSATFRQVFEGCGLTFDKRLQDHCAEVLDIPYNAFSEIRLDKWKDGRNATRSSGCCRRWPTWRSGWGIDGVHGSHSLAKS